jgi:hypothetical protein
MTLDANAKRQFVECTTKACYAECRSVECHGVKKMRWKHRFKKTLIFVYQNPALHNFYSYAKSCFAMCAILLLFLCWVLHVCHFAECDMLLLLLCWVPSGWVYHVFIVMLAEYIMFLLLCWVSFCWMCHIITIVIVLIVIYCPSGIAKYGHTCELFATLHFLCNLWICLLS